MTIADTIKMARRVSTPLIAVTTPDQPATVKSVVAGFNGTAPPMVVWDVVRGLAGMNNDSKEMLQKALPSNTDPSFIVNAGEALALAIKFHPHTILFFYNAQLFLDSPVVIQAICNLRDKYKSDQRTLVMLTPSVTMPPELVQDVMVIDEPLPSEERISAVIKRAYSEAMEVAKDLPQLDDKILADSIAALSGLAEFPADQTCAMSINIKEKKVDVPQMWDRKRSMINQTPGIQMLEDSTLPTFKDIGGLSAAKNFGSSLFNGSHPPRAIVWLDEIEKMFAGLGTHGVGDTSGVSQDQLGVMLREQEFNNWAGLIAVGPAGAGKSHFARALGRSHGAPTIMLDLGAMKGSLVGQSEQQVRAALKVVKAVAGTGGAFFVATCNNLTVLPPELRRRYKYGIWFFDLPDQHEREAIWNVCLPAFGLTGAKTKRTFDDEGWTGAEIRNVCELAWRLDQPLDEARKNIVPVSVSDADVIERLRTAAHCKFLSASYPGTYRTDAEKPTNGKPARKFYGE